MENNNVVFATVKCPHCEFENSIAYKDDFNHICFRCRKLFKVKRENLENIKPIEWNKRRVWYPPFIFIGFNENNIIYYNSRKGGDNNVYF